jgi:uncharacterized integral membrane protein (TIGR00697 family)
MTHPILSNRGTVLFFLLGVFLAANALLAELLGVKLFQLEAVVGLSPADFELLGQGHLSFVLSVGVLTWPLVFLATDVINDYFGVRAVRFLTLVTTALIAFAFVALYAAIAMPPDERWWLGMSREHGVPDMQAAFKAVFGQSLNLIFASLCAFLVSQLVDAWIFRWWKRRTGERRLWLRATGSTLVSQLVDSLVVTYVAFWLLRDWTLPKATAMALTAYAYKFCVAVLSTPLIYVAHAAIERYLGHEQAAAMRAAALLDQPQ